MLTILFALLSPDWAHRILGWLGIEIDHFHDWLTGLCPCEENR